MDPKANNSTDVPKNTEKPIVLAPDIPIPRQENLGITDDRPPLHALGTYGVCGSLHTDQNPDADDQIPPDLR